MSIRALPLIAIVLILYNLIVFTLGSAGVAPDATGGEEQGILRVAMVVIPMLNNPAGWTFTWGDLLILLLLITLFVEILKATYTATTALVDHGLSMLVFIVCLIEFLMVKEAQTSVFFFITVATAIDVIAGYTIGIRVARRDIGFGGLSQ
ncbi:MAG: hypothetical protein AAF732_08775 [Pseudomonadota bacterium]